MTGYQTVRSFECAPVDTIGTGNRLIAVGSGSEITLVSDTDRTTFEHDEPVVDIAINDRIIVLSSSQLSAYDREGARVWSRSCTDAHAIATLQDIQSIGVLGPETLRIVAAGTGQEQTTIDRDPPGRPDDDQFIGTDQGFVSSTWSFLRCITPAGKRTVAYNLDTAIRDIGYVDGVLVAALQNGQLKGFDLQSGEQRWETELSVRQISPNGDGALLLSTADGVKSITPDGAIDPVGSLTSGSVYADPTGALICSVNNGTVVTHVPDGELVDIEIVTESVGVGGTLDVNVRNVSDTDQRLTLSGALDHADLSPSERRLSLGPHESTLADFPVAAVRTDGEADFAVSIDDREVAQTGIEITDAAGSTLTAEADIHPTEISDGSVTLELSIENTGTVPLESIEVLETGARGTDIAADETWTNTLTKPYDPGRTITVGLAIDRGNRRTELAPTCKLPDKPSIELEQQRGALQARITADDSVTWADELVIEAPGAGRVRSPVEMTDGSLLVVVPTYEDGIARVGLGKVDVSEQARVKDTGPLSTLGRQSDRSTDRDTSTEEDSEIQEHNANTDQWSTDRHTSTEEDSEIGERNASTDQWSTDRHTSTETGSEIREQNASTDQWSQSETDQQARSRTDTDQSEPDRTQQPTDEPRAGTETSSASSETVTGKAAGGIPDLSIQRQLSDTQPPVGHTVHEELTVHNESTQAARPTVELQGEQIDLGSIGPGDSESISRRLAFFAATETQLPEARLRSGDTTVDTLPPETVTPVQDGVSVQGAIDAESGAYNITLTNHGRKAAEITQIDIDGTQVTDDTVRLDSGASTTLTGTLQATPRADTVTGSVTLASGDRIDTALINRSVATKGDAETVFDTEIGAETKVAGEYGTVVLVFENSSDEVLSDVQLTADGDVVNDILYSPAHRERLDPGSRIEHYVDLKAPTGTIDVECTAEYTADERRTRTYHATGPAVETEDKWTDEHRQSWALSSETDDTTTQPDFPEKLSTAYRTKRGNHR